MQLTYDLPHNVRLADAEEYGINSFDSFYGFVAGLMAGNYDIQEVFVDGYPEDRRQRLCGRSWQYAWV